MKIWIAESCRLPCFCFSILVGLLGAFQTDFEMRSNESPAIKSRVGLKIRFNYSHLKSKRNSLSDYKFPAMVAQILESGCRRHKRLLRRVGARKPTSPRTTSLSKNAFTGATGAASTRVVVVVDGVTEVVVASQQMPLAAAQHRFKNRCYPVPNANRLHNRNIVSRDWFSIDVCRLDRIRGQRAIPWARLVGG